MPARWLALVLVLLVVGCRRATIPGPVPVVIDAGGATEVPEEVRQALRHALTSNNRSTEHEWLQWQWHVFTEDALSRIGNPRSPQPGDALVRVVVRARGEDGVRRKHDLLVLACQRDGQWLEGTTWPNLWADDWRGEGLRELRLAR